MKTVSSSKKIPLIVLIILSASMVLLFTRTAPNKTLLANEQSEAADTYTYLPIIAKQRPIPQSISLVPIVAELNIDTITDITNAGDGRLFLLQRDGIIRIVDQNGTLLPDNFLNISNQIADINFNWELGALGLAFHPNFPSTPYVYISYTSVNKYRITLDRYTVNPATPNTADPNSRLFMLQIAKTGEDDPNVPVSPVHNGGDLAFGPDGYLYIGTGDGGPDPHFGSTNPHDPANNGQRTDLLLGKILRIDVNGGGGSLPSDCDNPKTELDGNYTIPADNPFVGQGGCDEIWSTGLRNPWRMSFDAETGDFYIADVGEWLQEEINVEAAGSSGGENYGWRCFEGTYDQTIDHPNYAAGCQPASAYDMPAHTYTHDDGCSITGGFVYRGNQYPILQGWYIFSDFCTGKVWLMTQESNEWRTIDVGTKPFISTFGEGADGELYAAVSGTFTGSTTIYHITTP